MHHVMLKRHEGQALRAWHSGRTADDRTSEQRRLNGLPALAGSRQMNRSQLFFPISLASRRTRQALIPSLTAFFIDHSGRKNRFRRRSAPTILSPSMRKHDSRGFFESTARIHTSLRGSEVHSTNCLNSRVIPPRHLHDSLKMEGTTGKLLLTQICSNLQTALRCGEKSTRC